MNKAYYTISNQDLIFRLELYSEDGDLLLRTKKFPTYKSCSKFLQSLKVHLCFQVNFLRTKMGDAYNFQIRTCWDELIAEGESQPYFSLREEAMQKVVAASKEAVFLPFARSQEVQAA